MHTFTVNHGQALQIRTALQQLAAKRENHLSEKDLAHYHPSTASAAREYIDVLQALTAMNCKPVTSLQLYDKALQYIETHSTP